jgi:hypothetical protein
MMNIHNLDQYDLTEIIGKLIRRMYVHPVRFEMVYEDIDLEDISDPDCEIDPETVDEMKTLGWDWIPYPGISTIKVRSNRTGNDDSRGGGCGGLLIPVNEFKYTITRETSVTIRDIVECVYRMKGSKYDWWYELFYGVNVLKVTDTKLTLKAEFDYGS